MMTKKITILGKLIPVWVVVAALVACGAGAAAGTVLKGKVIGEVNVAASQAPLVDAPIWQDGVSQNPNMPQQVYNHYHWINLPNRGIGMVADDNTAFEAAAELAIGDWAAFNLPIKNASDVPMYALMTLDVPKCIIEVEVYAATTAVNIQNPVRIGCNTWKFEVSPDAHYDEIDDCLMVVVVSVDDDCPPGYYTINGTIKQIAY